MHLECLKTTTNFCWITSSRVFLSYRSIWDFSVCRYLQICFQYCLRKWLYIFIWVRSDSQNLTSGQTVCFLELSNHLASLWNNTFWYSAFDHVHLCYRFTQFVLEEDANCTYDYLAAYDGAEEDPDMLLGSLHCGSVLPDNIISTSDTMTVVFHSDGSEAASGFIAVHTHTDRKCNPWLTQVWHSTIYSSSSSLQDKY